jgi:hypothetical protein
VLDGGDTLLSAANHADLLGEDESLTPLTDAELVQLVLSDNAPGLVDVLETDEQIIPEYSLSDCLTALELIQVTLFANNAFSAETEGKLGDVINEVSIVLRNTAMQANISVVSARSVHSELYGSCNSVATVKVNIKGITTSCTLNTLVRPVTTHNCYIKVHAMTSCNHYLVFQEPSESTSYHNNHTVLCFAVHATHLPLSQESAPPQGYEALAVPTIALQGLVQTAEALLRRFQVITNFLASNR